MKAHPIVHVELSTKDPVASDKFYHDIFGWNITVAKEFNYHMFSAEGGPAGGFVQIGEHAKAGDVLLYIDTDDIETTLAQIEKAGGKTLSPKMEIPGQGWFATFEDPSGNRMALYKAMTH